MIPERFKVMSHDSALPPKWWWWWWCCCGSYDSKYDDHGNVMVGHWWRQNCQAVTKETVHGLAWVIRWHICSHHWSVIDNDKAFKLSPRRQYMVSNRQNFQLSPLSYYWVISIIEYQYHNYSLTTFCHF